jgi:rare lipoprotein A (peptidoglycan hydrolase)
LYLCPPILLLFETIQHHSRAFLAFQLSSQTFVGTATIYSKKFDGRKTYSGQLFSSKKVSAAHPWLPMGTKVEVTNLKNKKKLIVTINDRMGSQAVISWI